MAEKQEESVLETHFIQFISMLSNSAMQHLGKIMNPLTGKIERNLEAARATIDLIAMLKKKTEGNLTGTESGVIGEALSNLQLNYADEVKREKGQTEKASPEKKPSDTGDSGSHQT